MSSRDDPLGFLLRASKQHHHGHLEGFRGLRRESSLLPDFPVDLSTGRTPLGQLCPPS